MFLVVCMRVGVIKRVSQWLACRKMVVFTDMTIDKKKRQD